MIERQCPFSCLRLAYWNARCTRKLRKRRTRLRVQHAAASDNQRFLRTLYPLGGFVQKTLVATRAWNRPNAFEKKIFGKVEGFRLHVLRKANRHRAGISWRSQYAQRLWQGSQQLFGPLNAIPVPRNRLEAVVRRDVLRHPGFQIGR